MARPTLYDRSRALIENWQKGASAPTGHVDRVVLATVLQFSGVPTSELPYLLRRSIALQTMRDMGMPDQRGEPWFETCIEAVTTTIIDPGPHSTQRRSGRPKSAPLLDLLITGAYVRRGANCPPCASRRRMQIETARRLGINHNQVRHALARTSSVGRELGVIGAVSLASYALTDLVGRALAARS